MSVIPNMVRFFTKKWENCDLFSPIVRGGGRGRGLMNLWKFADPSGLTLLGMVTIEVHVRLGCLSKVFHICFLGVSIDAFDRISFRVGYIITTIVVALVFVRGLFLGIVFCFFFMGAWVLALTFVLLFGLRYFLALR